MALHLETPPLVQDNESTEVTGLVLHVRLERQYDIWDGFFQSFSITAHLLPVRELDHVNNESHCLVFQMKC